MPIEKDTDCNLMTHYDRLLTCDQLSLRSFVILTMMCDVGHASMLLIGGNSLSRFVSCLD